MHVGQRKQNLVHNECGMVFTEVLQLLEFAKQVASSQKLHHNEELFFGF